MAKRPEPVQVVKQRRDAVLQSLVEGVPYIQFMGIHFDRRGDELTGVMPYADKLLGNPMLPALHGALDFSALDGANVIYLSAISLAVAIAAPEVSCGVVCCVRSASIAFQRSG